LAELDRQLLLLGDRSENRLAATDKVSKVRELILNGANLDLIQSSCCFLAISRDKRYCTAFVEQRDSGYERAQRYIYSSSDMEENLWGEKL